MPALGPWHAVVIQKPDLDTCLAGYLLGAGAVADLRVVRDRATPAELADPAVLCLECGGSGRVGEGNFDHHDTADPLPPACAQAFARAGGDAATARLVEYVAAVDTATLPPTGSPPPYLTGIFAGMALSTPGAAAQFRAGLALLATVLARGLDPFGTLPALDEWQPWLAAKATNDAAVEAAALAGARFFATASGLPLGYVETDFRGAPAALYRRGCRVVVAYSPRFGDPPAPKFTIAARDLRLDAARDALNEREPGWGGPAHGTILGSPRGGTTLTPDEVIAIVRAAL